MNEIKLPKVSVIIVNFNNSKLVNRCVKSVLRQTYPNIEIIFVDDLSTDDSISKIKKNKRIKIFKTKNKTKHGSFNQINACKTGLMKSSGDIIFFLDSDDFYKNNKIKIVTSHFIKKKLNICFDKPYLYFNKNKIRKLFINRRSKFITPWPQFGPQSCIAVRRKYLLKIWKKISIKKYKNIWLDFRLINQAIIDFNKVYMIPNYLTMYQQKESSASSRFKKFSKDWWHRRIEAYKFLKYLYKQNNKKFYISVDQIFTNLLTRII